MKVATKLRLILPFSSVTHLSLIRRWYLKTMRRAPLIALLFAALTIGGAAGSERARSADTYAPLAVYNEAMSIVRDQYVDEVPWPKLVGDGVAGMVETIDADGALLGPQPSPEPASAARPGDGDVGIVLARRGGAPVVIATRDGMPARAAGLRSGDAIVKIDGVTTQSMLAADAAARLRGRPGTEVALSVARTGWAEPKSV